MKTYLSVWQQENLISQEDVRLKIIQAGSLAPSSHNTQPWEFKLLSNKNTFEIYISRSRYTPEVDPDYRQTWISLGAWFGYASISALQFGYTLSAVWHEDWASSPNRMDSPIGLLKIQSTTQIDHPLYPYLFHPDTNRSPHKKHSIPHPLIDLIQSFNKTDVRVQTITDRHLIDNLSSLAYQAAILETTQLPIMKETTLLFRKNEREKNLYGYGFSIDSNPVTPISLWFTQTLLTVFPRLSSTESASRVFLSNMRKSLSHTEAILCMSVPVMTMKKCIEIGQVYAQIVCLGHSYGVACHPISQAIEVYDAMLETKLNIEHLLNIQGELMMLVRVGFPTKSTRPSIRQPIEKIIRK